MRPRTAGTLLAAALLVLGAPAAAHAESEDSNLDQTVEQDQPIVDGPRVLASGHVDMGPRFDDGAWTFLIHDDVGKADANAQSVWRYPDQTVLHVLDAAILTVPDDPAYAFIGVDPGTDVWVVPQTQNPEVVWVGWNTQDPQVMQSIDRGVTMSLLEVEGPGVMTVSLQSGTFGEPQVLWDSRLAGPGAQPQPVWVDVNTHTHANWVFTEPGVYLVLLEASAELIDGTTVTDAQWIRFAVGTATDPAEALAAVPAGGAGPAATADPEPDPGLAEPDAPQEQGGGPLVPILIAAIAVVVVGLVVGFAVAVIRGARTRRRILESRAGDADADGEGPA